MTVTAHWNGRQIAASDHTIVVEGNHYFDPAEVDQSLLIPSDHSTHCPWKGDASYYSIKIGDQINANAAWYYPEPKQAAQQIKGRIAFWKGVEIKEG